MCDKDRLKTRERGRVTLSDNLSSQLMTLFISLLQKQLLLFFPPQYLFHFQVNTNYFFSAVVHDVVCCCCWWCCLLNEPFNCKHTQCRCLLSPWHSRVKPEEEKNLSIILISYSSSGINFGHFTQFICRWRRKWVFKTSVKSSIEFKTLL